MYKICLAAGDETTHRLDAIQQRFSDIFREVELFDGQLLEDSVLQYHFIAFENWTDKTHYTDPVDFIRAKLNEMINNGQHQNAIIFIDKFSLRLKESFRIIRDLLSNKSSPYRDLDCLNRMGSFYPILIKTYKLDETAGKSNFEKVCRFLEIFSFRVMAMGKSRSDAGQNPINLLARDFSGKYGKLFNELTLQINRLSNRKSFLDSLSNTQFYEVIKSRDISYLIWKYENSLRDYEQPVCSRMSEQEFMNDTRNKQLTIEHIASQKSNSVVQDRAILSQLDHETLGQNLHRLGNLTFDPASANSSKSNHGIEIKNSKYFTKAPYKTQNELESFLVDGKWSIESIVNREKKIINFCISYWSPENIAY